MLQEGTADGASTQRLGPLSHNQMSCQVSLKCILQNTGSIDIHRYEVKREFHGPVSLKNEGFNKGSLFRDFPASLTCLYAQTSQSHLTTELFLGFCRITVVRAAGRADGLVTWGRAGSLPVVCVLRCVSVLAMVGVWVLPHEGKRDLLMPLMKLYRMYNNSSGTQIQVSHNRLDSASILRSLN